MNWEDSKACTPLKRDFLRAAAISIDLSWLDVFAADAKLPTALQRPMNFRAFLACV